MVKHDGFACQVVAWLGRALLHSLVWPSLPGMQGQVLALKRLGARAGMVASLLMQRQWHVGVLWSCGGSLLGSMTSSCSCVCELRLGVAKEL